MKQTEKELLLAEIEALKKKVEEMETPSENVDNRKLTPMGNVIDNFKKMTDYDFVNWMSVYQYGLLEQECEMVKDTFIAGYEGEHDELCSFEYFKTFFKQTA